MKILTIPNDNIIRVCNLLNQLIGDVTSKKPIYWIWVIP